MMLRLAVPALSASLLLVWPDPSRAHDWYPVECCHGRDCAPVETIDSSNPGGVVVTSRIGSGIIPESMPRRESKDHRMHVCMRPTGGGGGRMRVICVFIPPPS